MRPEEMAHEETSPVDGLQPITQTYTLTLASLSPPLNITFPENLSDPSLIDEDRVMGPQYHQRVRVGIIITMIVVSVFGNSVVCWKLLLNRRHRRVSKARVLFLNLAIADLLIACVTMTSQVVWEVMGRLWIAGDVFCRFFKVLQTFALVSSTYMLVSIALDRHIAIVTPLAPSPDPWRLAIGTWIAALLPSLPNFYVFHSIEVSPGKCYCASIFYGGDTPLSHRQIYMGFVFFMVFIGPLLLLFALYTGILLSIWRQGANSAKMGQQTGSALPRAKVKTLRITVVVFLAFIITNVPYMIQEMILAFGNPGVLDPNIVALFGVISASNSALNPYIYLFFQSARGQHCGFWSHCVANAKNSIVYRWVSRLRSSNGNSSHGSSSPPIGSTSKLPLVTVTVTNGRGVNGVRTCTTVLNVNCHINCEPSKKPSDASSL
ncbi:oxytocin receptor-like [Ornithodoros turicata]|uniref:oxytocin receptor-like n=1 Tax=Ornithodoros turicata TaxID=34597 RepID=UPI003138D2D1